MTDLTSQIIAYESGEMDEDAEVNFFQSLIDSGMAWNLQGHYGRTAQSYIDAGLCRHASASPELKPENEAHAMLLKKVDPVSLGMPPKWGAIFCFIIGKPQPTKQKITCLSATSDGFLMGSGLIENSQTLLYVLEVLIEQAQLTPDEVAQFKVLCNRQITGWDRFQPI